MMEMIPYPLQFNSTTTTPPTPPMPPTLTPTYIFHFNLHFLISNPSHDPLSCPYHILIVSITYLRIS